MGYTRTMILGVDEVGRGPWAGPLVVGAVVLGDATIEGLTDSKKLTKKRREALEPEIHEKASGYGLGWVHADELDELGISAALVEATKRAVSEIAVPYNEIIIDGTVNFLKETGKGPYVTTLKKADLLIGAVSAASVIAKVARDRYMEEQALLYPDYGFDSHVGYGTAAHRAAIERLGVTPLHRLSFAPLQQYRTSHDSPEIGPANPMTTKHIGDAGEDAAMQYLLAEGFTVIERNWKTRFCEIDIVASKDNVVYFVEVKHRKNNNQGGGVAAVTPRKLKQMGFAAQVFAKTYRLQHVDLRLAVATTVGDKPVVEELILVD